jgi:uncharacterized protein YjbI with pentapeptide repeats
MRRLQLAILLLILAFGVGSSGTSMAQPLSRLTRQQVEAVLRLGKNLALRDLSGLDLTGLNLSGANLREANLTGSNLEGVALQGAILRRAVLVRTNLSGAKFDGADFSEADLTEAILTDASGVQSKWTLTLVRSARIDGANLARAEMLGTRAEGNDFRRANLSEGSYIRARFGGSNLAGARLDRGTFTQASFAHANLAGASLRFARLSGADFRQADIAGASFAYAELAEALNLDSAKNADKALWQDPAVAVASGSVPSASKITARIVPNNGDPIDVESFEEHSELLSYVRAGATYGIPKANIRRIEDVNGRLLRDFVVKMPAVWERDCSRPTVGDNASYMSNYLKCLGKYKVRVNFSQGMSTKAAGEQGGRAIAETVLRRWEISDEGGRLIETYEALGLDPLGTITLAQ